MSEQLVLTRGTVVLDAARCKGCELCIDACPPRVLEMTTHEVNDWGFRFPVLLAGCIACQACTAICPDFCFQVYRYEEPVELPDGRGGVGAPLPGGADEMSAGM